MPPFRYTWSLCHLVPLRRGELAARAVDLPAAGVPYRRRYPGHPQPPDELPLNRFGARVPSATGCRVERDQIDMREPSGQESTEQIGPPRLVVHISDHRVLDRDTPASTRHICPG